MNTRERRQLRKLAQEMRDTEDAEQFALSTGCLELLDYLDGLLQHEEPAPTNPRPEPDMEAVTCWCRGEQLWQHR